MAAGPQSNSRLGAQFQCRWSNKAIAHSAINAIGNAGFARPALKYGTLRIHCINWV